MTGDNFDRESWERRWTTALGDDSHAVNRRPPNAHFLEVVDNLSPGSALDAGAGHGAETIWLAARRWQVTAVDFSATALAHARASAQLLGDEIAGRVDWVEADMTDWSPPKQQFDLVMSLYMHVAGSLTDLVRRLADAVAAGGTLLLVGHRPIDPNTGKPTPAAGQTQISVDEVVTALDPDRWNVIVAEDRPRPQAGSGVDAVVRATAID